MIKQLMIVDVTRMDHGNCCIAGVCPQEGGTMYRLCSPYISQEDVRKYGIKTGSVFAGNFSRKFGLIGPHVEDCDWKLTGRFQDAEPESLYRYFECSAATDLFDGLGVNEKGTAADALVNRGRSITTIRPQSASLQIMSPFEPGGKETLKMNFWVNGKFFRFITVNDFRFYRADGSIDQNVVAEANMMLSAWRNGERELYLRVGLTRLWKEKYWLQVDGLHFFDMRPTGSESAQEVTLMDSCGVVMAKVA